MISDNCSTDQTRQIIEKYRNKFESVLIENQTQNMGLSWNFNRVANLAEGQYFMWVPHDDFHEPTFISETLKLFHSEKNIVLATPLSKAVLTSTKETLWVASLESFRNCTTPLQRYKEVVRNFPAVAMYGIYDRAAMLRAGLLPSITGGDLVFIRALSLQGNFKSGQEVLFTRNAREAWNTAQADKRIFLGDGEKSKGDRLQSGFKVLRQSMHDISLAELKNTSKLRLTVFVIYISFSRYLKLKIIKYFMRLLPYAMEKSVAEKFYHRWFSNPNIREYSGDSFYTRIIMPSLRLPRKV